MRSTANFHQAPSGLSDRTQSSSVATSQPSNIAPHLRAVDNVSSSATSQQEPASAKLIDVEDTMTMSSASNPYEDAWSSTGTLGPWSAVDTRRRNAFYESRRPVPDPIRGASNLGPTPIPPATRHGWPKSVSIWPVYFCL